MCPGSPQKRPKRGLVRVASGNDMDDWLVLVVFQRFSNFHTLLWRRCPNDDQFDSLGWHLQPGGAKIEGQNPPTWDGVKHPVWDGAYFISTGAGFSYYITYVTVERANTTDSRRTMCNLWPDFDVVQVVIQVFCHCNYHPMYRSKPFLINHCGVSEWKSSSQVEERMIQWISSNTYLHLQRCANYIQLPDETLLGVWTWIHLHIFTVYTNVPQPEMKLNEFLKIYCWWFRNPAPPGMYKNLVNNGKKTHPPQLVEARHVGECGDPPEAARRWKNGPLGDMSSSSFFVVRFCVFYPWFCCKTMLKLLYFQSMLLNVYIENSDENDWV